MSIDPNITDPGPVPDGFDLPDGMPTDADMGAAILDMLDIPPIADGADPFATLDPQWRRLAGHLMDHFDPKDLPRPLRVFMPAAPAILASNLAAKPAEARATAVALIDLVVRDLRIEFAEVESAWESASPLHPEARHFVGPPRSPDA